MKNQKQYLGIPASTWMKCLDENRKMEICLNEGKLAHLITEELNEQDVGNVKNAIDKARNQIASLKKYISSMSVGEQLTDVNQYLSELETALNTAQGELARVNFRTNTVAVFFGEKMSLPSITRAAIALYAKASDFSNGFTKAVKNIQQNILPLVKDANKENSLRDEAGKNGVPTEKALKNGLAKALTSALGATFFDKVKNFFSGPKLPSAEKKIMSSLPKRDMKILATNTMQALLDAKIKDFEIQIPNLDVKTGAMLNDTAKDAKTDAASATSETVTSDDEKTVTAAAKSSFTAIGGKGEISKADFLTLLKKNPDLTGKGPKATRARAAFRKAVNAAAGKKVFEEALLISGRVKQEENNDTEIERWKQLAGIK